MLQQRKRKVQPKRAPIVGICAAAERLGVSRVTLWRAIRGQWHLPRLIARYEALSARSNKEEGKAA
jgi:hypothetical protein